MPLRHAQSIGWDSEGIAWDAGRSSGSICQPGRRVEPTSSTVLVAVRNWGIRRFSSSCLRGDEEARISPSGMGILPAEALQRKEHHLFGGHSLVGGQIGQGGLDLGCRIAEAAQRVHDLARYSWAADHPGGSREFKLTFEFKHQAGGGLAPDPRDAG